MTHAPAYSTRQFTFNGKTRTLVTEASSLQLDRMPAKMLIQSQWTNEIATFYFDKMVRNDEGEITSWVYEPAGPTSCKVVIFND